MTKKRKRRNPVAKAVRLLRTKVKPSKKTYSRKRMAKSVEKEENEKS